MQDYFAKRSWVPSNSKIWPTSVDRQANALRAMGYPRSMFESDADYFFFNHVDPYLRWTHVLGMSIGVVFFVLMLLYWGNWPAFLAFYFAGVFFFYFMGNLSHVAYDKGLNRGHFRYFLSTFFCVVIFNARTVLGTYQKSLKKFCEKYPFTVDAYDLVESDTRKPVK